MKWTNNILQEWLQIRWTFQHPNAQAQWAWIVDDAGSPTIDLGVKLPKDGIFFGGRRSIEIEGKERGKITLKD